LIEATRRACTMLTLFSLSLDTIIPSPWQTSVEMIHAIVFSTDMGSKRKANLSNRIYVPFFFTFFLCISSLNLSGMIPYSFTATSNLAFTCGHSVALYISAAITGLIQHQERLFDLFLPPRLPLILAPVLIALESVGYIARAISLGVRIAANMLAGHSLLKLICMLI
jgi:ATP synthase subunit 6